MKQNYKLVIVILLGLMIFSPGCKKGEDDPFLSFRTRTNRLTGEWKLKEAEIRVQESSSTKVISTNYSYSGTTMNVKVSESNLNSYVGAYRYSEEITFEKDGTYRQTVKSSTDVYSTKGDWFWTNKNKNLELEKKEALILTVTEDSEGAAYSGKSNYPQSIWVFKRLSNKEIIIELNNTQTLLDGTINSTIGTLKFIQE